MNDLYIVGKSYGVVYNWYIIKTQSVTFGL